MQLHQQTKWPQSRSGTIGGSLLLLCGLLGTGCPPPTIAETGDMALEDPPLDPRGLFESQVKPELAMSCSCHYTAQSGFAPFLTMGSEYDTITAYASGKFLTNPATGSPLINKGMHSGPPLSDAQHTKVLAWLQGEALTRSAGTGPPTTPTVAIKAGDFNFNLQALTSDPLANITFHIDQLTASPATYRVSKLTLVAGPTSGLHMKHPRFLFFSAVGANPDPSDALSNIDITVMAGASMVIGGGTVLLPNLPASTARLALAFEIFDKVNPTNVVVACKNYKAFNPAVKNYLATCAAQCHSPTAVDPRRSQASGSFNMALAASSVDADLQQLCINTLGRVIPTSPPASILITQPQPTATGGTTNHPFKYDANSFPAYQAAVQTWAAGEK